MENGLLYAFSTIAQALAGAIALISAFVLYRLQAIKSTWNQDTLVAVEPFRGSAKHEKLMRLHAEGNCGAFLRALDEALDGGSDEAMYGQVPERLALVKRLRASEPLINATRLAFGVALWMTAVTMIFSVVAIPFAHIVSASFVLAWALAAIGVTGFVASLISYVGVIRAVLRDL